MFYMCICVQQRSGHVYMKRHARQVSCIYTTKCVRNFVRECSICVCIKKKKYVVGSKCMVLLVLECSICVYVIRFIMCVLGLLYTLIWMIGPVEVNGATDA